MNRNDQLNKLKESKQWDVIIIGGGSSGLGVAIDAASRGFKTVLFECADFSKGTSSRSTKLIHGGVRYLKQGNIALVREALKERGLLFKNANHLVKNQSFIIPNYSWKNTFLYTIGLILYDLLSGALSLGRSIYISKKTTIDYIPTIEKKGLCNGIVYQDGQFDDSRLAINMAQTAVEQGACVLNYTKVIALLKDEKNKIIGLQVENQENGKQFNVYGKSVINATGVFIDDILKMDDRKKDKFVVPSQGIHLVLNNSFLPSDYALMIPKTKDGRVFFAVPWHNKIIVGTTDTLIKEPSFEPIALEKEIDFVLETSRQFLNPKPNRKDVLSVFAGLRPLVAPKKEGKKTKEISRSHKIIVSKSGLITITGGKWTTYRKIAKDTVDKLINVHNFNKVTCQTEHLSIHGNKTTHATDRTSHLYIYGTDATHILKLQNENPKLAEKLHPDYEYTLAEVVWAVREEMALNIEDILARRVRLLFLDARAAMEVAEKVAKIMAEELHLDLSWQQKQIEDFTKIANNFLLKEFRK